MEIYQNPDIFLHCSRFDRIVSTFWSTTLHQLFINLYNLNDMKIMKLIMTLIFMMGFGVITSSAQQGVVAASGEASGSGGTMSFSTGQTDFMFFSSETGSIQFGLQQVFFFDDDEIPIDRFLTSEDIFQGEDQCFDAYETIILAGGGDTFIVEDGTGIDLIAGQSILMLPGTMVEYGGYMYARISTDGSFCDVEEPIVASLKVDLPDGATYQEPLFTPEREKSDKAFFRVFPNPTTGDFTVEITSGYTDTPYTIMVYGMRGETIIRNDQLTSLRHHLSLQGQQPGLYIIKLQRGDEMGLERIIKR